MIPLLAAGVAMGAGGMLMQGQAAAAEAESAQNIANYNAIIMEREAKAIRQKTAFEQMRHAEAAARTKGALRARLATSGALLGVGAPLRLEEEQAAESELESMLIGYEGQRAEERALSQAELDRLSGRLAIQRGRGARTAAYVGAGATLLQGFGSVAYMAKQPTSLTSPTMRIGGSWKF